MKSVAVTMPDKDFERFVQATKKRGTTPAKALLALVRDVIASSEKTPSERAAESRARFAGRKNMGNTVSELRAMREGD